MFSLTSPYGRMWLQNSGVSPRRSSMVSTPSHSGSANAHVVMMSAALLGHPAATDITDALSRVAES